MCCCGKLSYGIGLLAREPILVVIHLLQKLPHGLLARVLLRTALHIHTLSDPGEKAIPLVAVHLLPRLLRTKHFGLLPRRHTAVLARFLPQLGKLRLFAFEIFGHSEG